MSQILIIDDDIQVCETMDSLITRMGHQCHSANTLSDGLARLGELPIDVVFLDIHLPDGNGLEALPEVISAPSQPEVIILTGKGDPDGAELAIQGGVWDFLVKPSPVKQIGLTLTRALKYRQEKQHLDHDPVTALNLENVAGRSKAMRASLDLAAHAAASRANVLITGETGTGKELFARTIHEGGERAEKNFVVVDCASLTESLVESTLFGHRKGAFTGAQSDRVGLVKLADGGTLFLDEVGEMPLTMQKVFLRVLQERRFRPVGDTREIRSDFRLISATNKDLEAMVKEGHFRRDLYYRLKTMHISLPALRSRPEDLEALTTFHVSKLCARYALPEKGFDPDFFEALSCYDWPGNVRELFNVLERAFVACGNDQNLYAKHLPSEVRVKATQSAMCRGRSIEGVGEALTDDSGFTISAIPLVEAAPQEPEHGCLFHGETLPDMREYKARAEKLYLNTLIRRTGGDVKCILKLSGLSRSHFYSLLKKHDVNI